jgi:alanyl-tRNA synthetase
VTDAGEIESEDATRRATLREAYRFENDQALLFEGDPFEEGERVRAVVPWGVRFPTMANHTATHLLHKALQEVLGDHVRQAGSAVRPDKLRFDFTHAQALSHEERAEVERRVNEKVFANLPVHIFETPIEDARKLGAMMLFGEKYGEVVRVVEIGDGWSRELCGGTHVRWTAEVGPFAILTEGSVGSGARRIEAVTAGEAYAFLHERAREADELRAELERVRKEAKKAAQRGGGEYALKDERAFEVGGVNALVAEVPDVDPDRLLEVSDAEKQKRRPAAVVLATRENGKVHLVANFDNDVGQRVSAADVIKQTAAVVGGGGGGRATMARAGGSDPEKLPEALETARRLLQEGLS